MSAKFEEQLLKLVVQQWINLVSVISQEVPELQLLPVSDELFCPRVEVLRSGCAADDLVQQ